MLPRMQPLTRGSTILLPLLLGAFLPGQFVVNQVTPTHDTLDASALGHITWTLSAPVNPATVNAGSVMVFGRWSGVMNGTRSVENGGTTIRFVPASPFTAGENVAAMLTTALQSASGPALLRTHTTTYWTAAAAASSNLGLVSTIGVRLPGEPHIQTYGAYAGDLDNDGFCDLCVPNEISADVRRFMNNGDGTFSSFTIHGLPAGSKPSASEGADFDGDGWTDIAVCNINGNSVAVFFNDGTGGLLPALIIPVGAQPRGIAVFDADSNGTPDIMTANRNSGTVSLIRNNGNGTFQPATSFQGGVSNETSLAAGDANGDGNMDLFVGGYGNNTVALMLGDGLGGFAVAATVAAGGRPWMLASGDVDGDGDIDVVAALSNTGRASVMRNDGAGGFLPATTYLSGSFTLAIDLGDLDGDGDLDMVTSNYSGNTFSVFRNNGNGTFAPAVQLPAIGAGSCAIIADLDGDEDMELIGIDEIADVLFFYQTPQLPVQQASHAAALDVDGVGGSPGFGGAPNLPVTLGAPATIGFQGHPGQWWLLAIGLPTYPGLFTPAGVLGIALAPAPVFLVDGFTYPGAFVLDAAGAAALTVNIPAWLPPGLTITMQGLATNPANLAAGLTLTNPMTVVTTP